MDKKETVRLKDVWFRYEKNGPDVIKDLSFRAFEGELFALVGGNGTGKTTALSILAGLLKPYRGKAALPTPEKKSKELVTVMLPQNPQTLFVKSTVKDDLLDVFSGSPLSKQERLHAVLSMAKRTELSGLLESHPYDLSGGEQQRAALCKVLLLRPRLLLLDEPTKGLDSFFKATLASILHELLLDGVTVVMVSHDVEFCARYADRCAMFFDGGIVSEGAPREFFSGNSFYTTAANRMSRHLFSNAVVAEDVITLCEQNK